MNAVSVYPGAVMSVEPGEEFAKETFPTTRFGEVEVIVDSIISFPDGLIGLAGNRYALLSTDSDSPFLWLQSLDDPATALPVTNPHRFFQDFAVELADADAEQLGLDEGAAADVYVTVTASRVVADLTVNLKAPILIRDRRGNQVLNQTPGAKVKTPLFPAQAASA
jgi:flagellar assembly factor FliW